MPFQFMPQYSPPPPEDDPEVTTVCGDTEESSSGFPVWQGPAPMVPGQKMPGPVPGLMRPQLIQQSKADPFVMPSALQPLAPEEESDPSGYGNGNGNGTKPIPPWVWAAAGIAALVLLQKR